MQKRREGEVLVHLQSACKLQRHPGHFYRVLSMAQLDTIRVGIKLFTKVISALMEFLQKILQCDRWKGGGRAGPSAKCV